MQPRLPGFASSSSWCWPSRLCCSADVASEGRRDVQPRNEIGAAARLYIEDRRRRTSATSPAINAPTAALFALAPPSSVQAHPPALAALMPDPLASGLPACVPAPPGAGAEDRSPLAPGAAVPAVPVAPPSPVAPPAPVIAPLATAPSTSADPEAPPGSEAHVELTL